MSRLVASCTLVLCFLEESSKITDRRFWFPAPRFIATCCFYFQQAIMSYCWSSRPIGNMLKNSRPPHNHCFYHFPPPQTKHCKEGDISDALEFETWFAQASTPSGPLPDVAIGSDALNIGKNDEKCIRGSILSVFASLVHFGIMVLTASRPRSNLAAFSTSGKRMVSTSAPWHKLKFVLAEVSKFSR